MPEGKSMWMRAFYGFGPANDGYVGWSREAARDRVLRKVQDGDLFMIYGSGTAETEKALRSYVLGFVQVDARAIRDTDKSSPDALKRKTDNRWSNRWTYGIPVRRAWRAEEKLTIRTIAFKTYRPEAGQGLGVWGAVLDPKEIEQALKIRVTEVSVYGEPPVSGDGLNKEPFANQFQPSRAFPGSSGERTSVYEDGETFLYLARFEGDGHALVGKSKPFADKSVVMKIGISNEPKRRTEELNSGIPPAALGKWKMELVSQAYPNRKSAEAVEQTFKDNGKIKLESLGKEFFWGDWTSAMLLFSALPGMSRF